MIFTSRTGEQFEQEFFNERARRTERVQEVPYQDFHASMARLPYIQSSRFSWNPGSPKSRASAALFKAVKARVGFAQANQLRLYCAIGTSLDVHHGADGVFAIKDSYVCIDLTIDPKKKAKRDDVVLVKKQDLIDDRFEEIGNAIGEILLQYVGIRIVGAREVEPTKDDADSRFSITREGGQEGRILAVSWSILHPASVDDVNTVGRRFFQGVKSRNLVVLPGPNNTVVLTPRQTAA